MQHGRGSDGFARLLLHVVDLQGLGDGRVSPRHELHAVAGADRQLLGRDRLVVDRHPVLTTWRTEKGQRTCCWVGLSRPHGCHGNSRACLTRPFTSTSTTSCAFARHGTHGGRRRGGGGGWCVTAATGLQQPFVGGPGTRVVGLLRADDGTERPTAARRGRRGCGCGCGRSFGSRVRFGARRGRVARALMLLPTTCGRRRRTTVRGRVARGGAAAGGGRRRRRRRRVRGRGRGRGHGRRWCSGGTWWLRRVEGRHECGWRRGATRRRGICRVTFRRSNSLVEGESRCSSSSSSFSSSRRGWYWGGARCDRVSWRSRG